MILSGKNWKKQSRYTEIKAFGKSSRIRNKNIFWDIGGKPIEFMPFSWPGTQVKIQKESYHFGKNDSHLISCRISTKLNL